MNPWTEKPPRMTRSRAAIVRRERLKRDLERDAGIKSPIIRLTREQDVSGISYTTGGYYWTGTTTTTGT